MIPLGTDRPNRRPTLVTFVIIAATVAAFIVQMGFSRFGDPSVLDGFVLESGERFRWWSLAGYIFLHGNIPHLFFNMLFLWVFGPNVEDRLGRIGFAVFYLLGGAAAGAAHMLASPNPVIGASGAVAAVTGAFLVLFPRTRIRLLLFFIIIGLFSIPSWWFIVFAIARDFLWFGSNDGISHAAHLGGYGFGAGVALVLLATKIVPREPYDLFSIAKHKARQRRFKEAVQKAETAPSRVSTERKMSRAEREAAEAVADARAAVSTLVAEGKLEDAVAAYRDLLAEHGHEDGAGTLNRAHQIAIANHMFSTSEHQTAASAYERFLHAYPNDAETPGVRLMLGLINARYLNDPVRAKQLVKEARGRLKTDEEENLANELLEELG